MVWQYGHTSRITVKEGAQGEEEAAGQRKGNQKGTPPSGADVPKSLLRSGA